MNRNDWMATLYFVISLTLIGGAFLIVEFGLERYLAQGLAYALYVLGSVIIAAMIIVGARGLLRKARS